MIEELIKELKLLNQKDILLTKITNALSCYFTWSNCKMLREQYEKNLKTLLEEYYELINEENNNESD